MTSAASQIESQTESLTITRPDDWHVHLRDNPLLPHTVAATAATFARAIVMPNLAPPVTTVELAEGYYQRIVQALPTGMSFEPLMVLYLTADTSPQEIAAAAAHPHVHAVKLYPAGATTNSAYGVRDPDAIDHLYAALEENDLPLLMHGEVIDPAVDIFDRERVFIERHLLRIREKFPALRMVLEHITTGDAVQFVLSQPKNTAATITPQHLMLNRNDLLAGGIRPHNYCLPILKRRTHQEALRQVITTNDARFFLGTDSAPHAQHAKETACGCAGCYSAPAALAFYATVFEECGALQHLEAFASHHGPDFYRLPRNTETVTLVRQPQTIPEAVDAYGTRIIPWQAGGTIPWSLA
ncbi:MAG: dihydroorotase [Planctomycetota bacterium]|nr:MAG: dihydroorotase [Planctomycetota bacterium]